MPCSIPSSRSTVVGNLSSPFLPMLLFDLASATAREKEKRERATNGEEKKAFSYTINACATHDDASQHARSLVMELSSPPPPTRTPPPPPHWLRSLLFLLIIRPSRFCCVTCIIYP